MGLCRGRFENPVDIIINETHGGIGSYLLAGNPLPGLTLQAYPVAQMGGAEAVRSRFRQMQSEASGNPLQVFRQRPWVRMA